MLIHDGIAYIADALAHRKVIIMNSRAPDPVHEGPTVRIVLTKEDVSLFLACLGLGVLTAIERGMLPAEAGIWTLAPPRFWEPFEGDISIDQRIVAVFREADEIHALSRFLPEEYAATMSRMMSSLYDVLESTGQIAWSASWSLPEDTHQ